MRGGKVPRFLPPLQPKPKLPESQLPGDFEPPHPAASLETQDVLNSAQNDSGQHLLSFGASGGQVLLSAIDPTTVDSALHRAAAAGNTGFMTNIPMAFGPQWDHRLGVERCYWLLIVHQNLAGDTALHAAAKTGNLPGVKGVYRLLHRSDVEDDPERGEDSEDPMVEFWTFTGEDGDAEWDEFGYPSLAVVCMRNKAGRTAADEARLAGHEDVAAWLDALAERLDPQGRRADTSYVLAGCQMALEYHRYLREDDEDDKEADDEVGE